MNKSFQFSFLFLLLVVCCFNWTQGLRCYGCLHVDSDDIPEELKEFIEESCQEGQTPNSNLLIECEAGNICGKFHAKRAIPLLGSAEISARACVKKIDDLLNKCVDNKTTTEISKYGDKALDAFLELIPEDEIPTICTSDDESDDKSSSSMLKMSQGLLMFPFAFLAIKVINFM